ncbi:MAG: alpha-amylase family glycosyl hydrolase [Firmicutes bacterium]|nr:alpha-amylase family glycosyl hydrolase [Bacillota bacterium]
MHLPEWLKTAVFYEIYPQSFCDSNGDGIGDFPGMTSRLDYLKELGINAIWINPCFASPFMDAGYDITDYLTIAPRYGTNEDAREFFRQAHRRGIRVLLDLVPGHTSDQHPWFRESRKPEKNEYSNRYIWTKNAFDYPAGFRLQSGLSDRNGNYVVNFFSSQPALNYGFENREYDWQLPPDHPDCQATVNAMKQVMRFWLDAGCDGFRVDMAYSLVKNDPEFVGTQRLWQDIRGMLERDYPEAVILSEWSCAEKAIDAGFHLDFYIHFNCKGYNALFQTESLDYVDPAKAVSCFFSREGKGNIRAFTDEFTAKLDYIRGRGYMCVPTGNHDMIRYSHKRTPEELKVISAFLLLLPCVPFLYYGDEIGMRYQGELTSKEGGYFRTGSRTPMQWDAGKSKGFSTADTLYLPVDGREDAPDCASQMADPDSLWNTVRRFIALRQSAPDFRADGDFEILYAEENRYPFVFRRGRYAIAVNPSASPAAVHLPGSGRKVAAANGDGTWESDELRIRGVSLAVFEIA